MKYLILILLLTTSSAFADERKYTPTPAPLSLPSQTTYGLLALAAPIPFDWGVPDKIQVGATMAFTEGGNQAVSIGVATRFGGILVHGRFVTTIEAPDSQDDYAVIVGGLLRY